MKTIGERLKQAREKAEYNKAELARLVGISKAAIGQIENGTTSEPSPSNLFKIASVLDVSAEWLTTGKSPPSAVSDIVEAYGADMIAMTGTRRSPIVGIAQMGDDGYWYENGRPMGDGDGYIEAISHDVNCYSLEVRGDSMFPAIRDGWFVVVEPNSDPVPGEYVVVKTTDGRSMVKELLWSREDSVSLQSVNDLHGRTSIRHEDIEFIHHVAFVAPPSKRKID